MSAFTPNDFVVSPFIVNPLMPILSSPKLTLSVKFEIFIFNPAEENNGLSARPCEYNEICFDESLLFKSESHHLRVLAVNSLPLSLRIYEGQPLVINNPDKVSMTF